MSLTHISVFGFHAVRRPSTPPDGMLVYHKECFTEKPVTTVNGSITSSCHGWLQEIKRLDIH